MIAVDFFKRVSVKCDNKEDPNMQEANVDQEVKSSVGVILQEETHP